MNSSNHTSTKSSKIRSTARSTTMSTTITYSRCTTSKFSRRDIGYRIRTAKASSRSLRMIYPVARVRTGDGRSFAKTRNTQQSRRGYGEPNRRLSNILRPSPTKASSARRPPSSIRLHCETCQIMQGSCSLCTLTTRQGSDGSERLLRCKN